MKINIRRAKLKDIDLIFRLGKKTKELQFSNKMNFHDKVETLFKTYLKHANTKNEKRI